MKPRSFLISCLIIASGFVIAVLAQNTVKQPVPIKAIVSEVTDNRSFGMMRSECRLELIFASDSAANALAVRKVIVKRAVDELGRDITPTDEDLRLPPAIAANRMIAALRTQLKLRSPSRHATVINLVEGEVEFFSPTPANNGICIIRDILTHPSEPIQNAILKKYGIELTYLSKESYEEKKKEFDEQQKKAIGGGLGEAFGRTVNTPFGTIMPTDSKSLVRLYVKDPDNRVLDLEFQDANGKPLIRRNWSSSGVVRNYGFDSPPPAGTQLLMYLATPEAVQTLPFKIENIPLP